MASNSDESISQKPIHIRAIHPERDAQFQAVAAKRKDIKDVKSSFKTACTHCLKTHSNSDKGLLRCSKCKGVWYCSKECQRANWPQHKRYCSEVEGSGILKLAQNFFANHTIQFYLQVCLIFEFDLLEHPNPKTPFLARFDVGIEPTNIVEFFDLFTSADSTSVPSTSGATLPEKMEGMFQLNLLTADRSGTPLTDKRMTTWKYYRQAMDAAGQSGDPLGLIEMVKDSPHSLTMPVHIQKRAIEFARKGEPFEKTSAVTGEVKIIPLSANSCIEYINMHIRQDVHNQILLRTDMLEADKELIRAAGRGETRHAVLALKNKTEREAIYTPTYAVAVEVA